jgi:hypothetical protein
VACKVAGSHGSGFLRMKMLERMRIQKSSTHNPGAEACYSGLNYIRNQELLPRGFLK